MSGKRYFLIDDNVATLLAGLLGENASDGRQMRFVQTIYFDRDDRWKLLQGANLAITFRNSSKWKVTCGRVEKCSCVDEVEAVLSSLIEDDNDANDFFKRFPAVHEVSEFRYTWYGRLPGVKVHRVVNDLLCPGKNCVNILSIREDVAELLFPNNQLSFAEGFFFPLQIILKQPLLSQRARTVVNNICPIVDEDIENIYKEYEGYVNEQ